MGEVQSARHPSLEPRVQSQGSADDSDTPGTRALWSKLREIAQLQESDPSVALAIESSPIILAGSLALCAHAPSSWELAGRAPPRVGPRREPRLPAADNGAGRSSIQPDAATEPQPQGDGLSVSSAAPLQHSLSRVSPGSIPGVASADTPSLETSGAAGGNTMANAGDAARYPNALTQAR